jgi:serine/threonine-protein kinase
MTDGSHPSGSNPAAEASLVGEILDRRYRIIKKLGEGGMGEVYAAEHVHIDKRLAIKLLRPEIVSNKEAVNRFYQEARSASSIGHRNIIGIEDFGELPDGRIFMAMELLAGAPLNDMIKSPMPLDRLLNILIQTGHGLAAAHQKGIVHRDMKPENIYVTQGQNGEDVPKLLDFGIAKVAGNDGQNNLTKTGTIFGTPFYMAPEQALGQQVGATADVYAMGVIMYEVFSGSLPFQGESFMGILTQHITTEPEPVANRAATAGRFLPPPLADVISRCMQKDPSRRYATMNDLVNALIEVYRATAGAGMSSYMEAFVLPRTGQVPAQTPRTGPYGTPMPQQGQGQASLPTVVAQGGSQPYAIPQGASPSTGMPAAGSGLYASAGSSAMVPVKKGSKAGLIFALIAVVAVAGGVVAFVVLDKKKKDGGSGDGTGSVAAGTNDGTSDGSEDGTGDGTGGGSVVQTTPDAEVVASVTDAGTAVDTPPDAAEVASGTPDAAEAKPATVSVIVDSKNASFFEVYEGKTLLGTSATIVEVEKGKTRTITLKARGYKDKTIVLDGTKKKVVEKLEREKTDTPKLDCSSTLKDPKNQKCKDQYCLHNPTKTVCLE